MATQSKELNSLEKKKKNAFWMYFAGFTQLTSTILLNQVRVMLLIKHLKDGGKTVHLFNRLSSMAAIVEFFLNPILGSLSDSRGRKLFLCAAPLASLLLRFRVARDPSIRNIFLSFLVTSVLVPAFFTSVTAAAGDMFQGDSDMMTDISGKLQVVQGFALVCGPLVGSYLASRDHRLPFLMSSVLGGVSLLIILTMFRETLSEKDKKPFKMAGINPLSFTKLFSGKLSMAKLNLILALQSFPMFMGNVSSVFAKEQRNWGTMDFGRFQSAVGLAGILAGYLTTPGTKRLGTHKLSILANGFAVASYIVWGMANTTERAYLGLALNTFGQMRLAGVRTRITNIATEEGTGQGEITSDRANLVAVVKAIAPLLFASLFARGRTSDVNVPGLAHFGAASLLGVAELVLLSMNSY